MQGVFYPDDIVSYRHHHDDDDNNNNRSNNNNNNILLTKYGSIVVDGKTTSSSVECYGIICCLPQSLDGALINDNNKNSDSDDTDPVYGDAFEDYSLMEEDHQNTTENCAHVLWMKGTDSEAMVPLPLLHLYERGFMYGDSVSLISSDENCTSNSNINSFPCFWKNAMHRDISCKRQCPSLLAGGQSRSGQVIGIQLNFDVLYESSIPDEYVTAMNSQQWCPLSKKTKEILSWTLRLKNLLSPNKQNLNYGKCQCVLFCRCGWEGQRVKRLRLLRNIVQDIPACQNESNILNFNNMLHGPLESQLFIRPAMPLRIGMWVIHRCSGWIGKIVDLDPRVYVNFTNRLSSFLSKFVRYDADNLQNVDMLVSESSEYMHPISPPTIPPSFEHSPIPILDIATPDMYYTGLLVIATSTFNSVYSGSVGQVTKVIPENVTVEWVMQGYPKSNSLCYPCEAPKSVVAISSLCVFDLFQHTWWCIGDRAMITLQSEDRNMAQIHANGLVVSGKCDITVRWEDSTISTVPSISLLHLAPAPHHYAPYDFVKKPNDDGDNIGMVLSANSSSRMCYVQWLNRKHQEEDNSLSDSEISNDIDSDGEEGDYRWLKSSLREIKAEVEYISTLDLARHSVGMFRPGDIVLGKYPSGISSFHNDWWVGVVYSIRRPPSSSDADICVGVVWLVDEETSLQSYAQVGFASACGFNYDAESSNITLSWESAMNLKVIHDPNDMGPINDSISSPSVVSSSPENIVPDLDAEMFDAFDESVLMISAAPLDHYFLNNNNDMSIANTVWLQRIHYEWEMLSSSLPPNMWVLLVDNRPDIMRSLIIGPDDTPYQDALLIFDILLPSTYPSVPPQVYFHSHGLRLNPNLYDRGTVCLSLLGTWKGSDDCENWSASCSILQVLLSIQALILVSQPYYNEPGSEIEYGTDQGDFHSKMYNESARLLSLEHLLHTIKNPPVGMKLLIHKILQSKIKSNINESCRDSSNACNINDSCSNVDITKLRRIDRLKILPSKEDMQKMSEGYRLSITRLILSLQNELHCSDF